MGTDKIRDGVGHRAYRRKQAALKRRTARENLPCGYGSPSGWGCGEHIDTTLPHNHKREFTADHDVALGNGGKLLGQVLVPMHRDCNSRKNDNAATEIWAAT
ncbi:hypothetical protein [Microbacterium imperiale]|uniref:HNH endonuclease n=1 Tax=Microbacterium imperiale TaxID=33884 RepID=A0A9W6HEM2_9MICO|nr:hypothetical protein [Microbacterium imperiale]MBP2420012.1 5-methylcytosine-specific restriction endonuclease McrA [Microbacterium imperiale]MDS0198124.1 hypothetical protein [Microbacterium imperiale]BFE40354.1 hypothetical protein GCM10017544_13100 [Microbacterium imperiale]GLJ78670.1 hypothetical protein GCM10017586_03520 [Microbacterium imperiale]